MKKIYFWFLILFIGTKLCGQDLKIVITDTAPYYEFQQLHINIFLINNTPDTLTYFNSLGPSYHSFTEEWNLSANNKFLEILPLNGAFTHKYSDSCFIHMLPGSENLIRQKTITLDFAGDYSFTYSQQQGAHLVDKTWADSTVSDSLIQLVSTFQVSKNIKFDVYINFDTVIHEIVNMSWVDWKDYRHVQLYSRQKHFDNLEAAFSYPQDVYSLKLYADALTQNQIKQLGRLRNLRKLELRNYTLDYFPEELVNLDLYELVIIPKSKNSVAYPYGISKNKTLRELSAHFQDSLPADVLNQIHLQILDISDSDLDSLPALNRLQDLEKLVANNNTLRQTNSLALEQLPKLVDLNLSGNKQIHEFGTILNCTNLEFLTINRTGIDSIPDEIKKLAKLKQLSVSNKLVFISDSIGNLQDMRILSFGGNTQLNYLPASVTKMKRLLQLNINRTAITQLPEGITDLPLEKLQSYDAPLKKNKDYFLLKHRLGENFKD